MSERPGGSVLAQRTKRFALRVIRLYSSLPRGGAEQVLGRQLLRSGTSVGAHYREATRARSTAEFVSKLQGGLQELEESCYWLELLSESGMVGPGSLEELLSEAGELTAMMTASVKTAKSRRVPAASPR